MLVLDLICSNSTPIDLHFVFLGKDESCEKGIVPPMSTKAPKKEQAKDEPPKEDPPKEEQPKKDPPKQDPPKEEPPKEDPLKKDPSKEDQPKPDPPKDESPKNGQDSPKATKLKVKAGDCLEFEAAVKLFIKYPNNKVSLSTLHLLDLISGFPIS